jgi:AraC family transcriptional regulator, transcriptional activator of pobA
MIPTHSFPLKNIKPIRMNELTSLMSYDATLPHRHNYYEFFVFLKGGGSHSIDFIDFPIQDGSIHIVAPDQVHQVKRELDSHGYVFLFDAEVFQSSHFIVHFLNEHLYHRPTELAPIYHFTQERKNRIEQTVQAIWGDFKRADALKNEILLTGIMQLCLFCMEKIEKVTSPDMTKHDQLYFNFRKLLLRHFRSKRKVTEYAQLLYISEKTLNAITHARTGNSASQLIGDQIVLEAKRLLQIGASGKEIAFALHFEDPSHFSKFFKGKTGTTPSKFQFK